MSYAKAVAEQIRRDVASGKDRGVFRCVCGRFRGWYVVEGPGDPMERIGFTDHAETFEEVRGG